MHLRKNSRMLEEIQGEDNAIELFLMKYALRTLDDFPKCTLGHFRSVLTELGIIRPEEWEYFLNLVREHMMSLADYLSFSNEMEQVIPEEMHTSVHNVLSMYYRDKLDKKTRHRLLTGIHGHPFYRCIITPYC